MKRQFKGILTLFFALLVQLIFAQEKTIKGTVSDKSGALPSVNIVIKGTTKGTETDFDGKYSIKAKTGDILIFSYLGYKTIEKQVGTLNTIDVILEENGELLPEIVLTALGIKRDKKSLGFAQQSVKSENLVRSRETNLNNALAGKVAGVQAIGAPSAGFGSSQIRLRGNSNILYVVDNIKVGSASDINMDDIADISILKGSAATALYGPEGINGAILITTKSAPKGEGIITINHASSFENVYLLPEYQNEYGGGYSQNFSTFNFDPTRHPASWASFNGQPMVDYKADESWGPKLDGQLVRHWDSWIEDDPEFGKLRPFTANPNNVKNFFNTGIVNNTSISFAKRGEDYNLRIGLTNIERTAAFPNSKRKQVQATINANYKVDEKLTILANLNYQDRRTKNFPDNGYGNVASNFNQWWQRQIDIDRVRNYKRNKKIVSWNINGPTNTSPLYWDSPFFEVFENLNFQTRNALFGRIGLKYDFDESLNVQLDIKKNFSSSEFNNRVAFGSLGGQTLPSYSESESESYRDELFGILNYSDNLSEDIDINANVGFELSSLGSKSISGSTNGGLSIVDFYSLNTSIDRPSIRSSSSKFKSQSVFAKTSFGYKDLLYIDGSARLDWASSANPNDNRVDTYGASLSFVFSELIPKNDFLRFGKFRASTAQAPRFPGQYSLFRVFSVGTPYENNGTLSNQSSLENPLLKGGIRKDFEIGTELKLFNNRLGIDFTYFKKIDSKLPVSVTLDDSTGYTSTRKNDGKQTYKGIETAINYDILKKEDLNWDVTLNFATLTRFVDKISEGIDVNILSNSWRGIQLQERVGKEWGAIYGRAFKRDSNGQIILSSSGTPLYETNQYLGNVLPDFTGGFSSNFRYKNFSIGFDIDFQKGGKVFSTTRMFNNYSGLGIETVGNNNLGNPVRDAVADGGGVLIEGVDETTGKPVSYNIEASTYWHRLFALHERWLYDASYIKLRTLRIDYSFPKEFVEKLPFKSFNIGLFANNVWLIYSSIPGLDPSEIETSWTEGGQLPNVRTIGLNIKMTF